MKKQNDEEARIEAAVAKRLEQIVAAQQQAFAKKLEAAAKNALGGIEQANSALKKEQKAVEKELDAVKKLRTKAEQEGEKMAREAYEAHIKQYNEAARISLLRDLTRMHIEVGKTNRDIAVWLDVPQEFVENIRRIANSAEKYYPNRPKRALLEGNPKVWTTSSGRSGAVHFESRETSFQLWWEMGAYAALAIVEAPTVETWEKVAQLPLEKRMPVLNFIGEQLVLQKTYDKGSFIIGENVMTIFSAEQ
jgi:hypothetical protein